ncbi:thiamine-phosphate pyrophosphorylase [Moraxella macacae 0408225]|uniref:Thiamine-phosphate synthase n=1 Tax=Moraxella macacae 0408225 TaxID=1230338 RepID=L2F5C2_9GAMM|nr:thiamine phosphate synthase [Moraxella macacae]ELA08254.1 thiamine-phosphate pyrophosphorylase [Moraxella macacae 0408225]
MPILNTPYQLYLVTDTSCLPKHTTLIDAVEQAILGGVSMVQLREKTATTQSFYEQALAIKNLCQAKNIPLLINDRLDIALAVGADGVHLGQSDMPCHVARRILGADKIIGVSVKNASEAKQAKTQGANYLGVGAVFETTTKSLTKPLKMETLAQIVHEVDLPIVLIGGINETNLSMLQHQLKTHQISVAGVAMASAILAKSNPFATCQQLKQLLAL